MAIIIGLGILSAVLAIALVVGGIMLLRYILLTRRQERTITEANENIALKAKFISNISAQLEPTFRKLDSKQPEVKALLNFSQHIQTLSALESSEEEIYLVFPDYSKFVSRKFPTREDAIADKAVTDLLCYRCRRMLRKKIRWFTGNQRYYYCLGECPEHGYVKGKIRMKHTAGGEVYAIKTIKLTDEAGAELIRRRKEETTDRRRVKSRLKHAGNPGRQNSL